jgi:uncharacterized membrane protein
MEQLYGIELFGLLDPDDCLELAGVVDYLPLPAGKTLFQAGDPGDSLIVVKSGEIELSVNDTTGQKIVLMIAGPDDLFGELSLLETTPRNATAVAVSASEVIILDRGDLLLFFEKRPDAALHMLAAMSRMMQSADELLRTRVVRNVNEEMEEKLSLVERVADWIAWFSGSMTFLSLNLVWFLLWILINTTDIGIRQFDPFPFGLLTMIVSLEAIFLSIFVLISQNRQAAKDRIRADIEYDVNVKAEQEVAYLHEKTDRIYETMVDRFARLERRLAAPEAATGGNAGNTPGNGGDPGNSN